MFGFKDYDYVLHAYLNKFEGRADKAVRLLSVKEYAIIQEYRKLYKEINVLIAELVTMITILGRLDNDDLRCIIANLNVMVSSLAKQRDFTYVTKLAFSTIKPNEKERACVDRLLIDVRKRLLFLKTSIIPSNLRFTPIKEYLEINQCDSFEEDLCAWFDNVRAIVRANKGETDGFDQYVGHIIETVQASGKLNCYKDRVQAYIQLREEKARLEKLEKAQEKIQRDQGIAQAGIKNFQKLFYRAVATLDGDKRIHMGSAAVRNTINTHGRDIFFVLCCYNSRGNCVFCYLGDEDKIVQTFAKAHVFANEAEASEAMNRAAICYPEKTFDIAYFAYATM